ncbi:YSIRK-type signal peptide-containing protein, partial [Staphylococcus pseudintermedius]|nr:YSIRK-type signal peptide-containing protein [Staphylococcus pseudintermedius]EGQ3738545.1 YSIRK-type signal peptide-containing protein [Staphylococcus pseudintermedius]EIM5228509.1 YSIRK-type signal peptide-containing protein [Staphylococcus pseudintermedius]EJF1342771.1 YSIRK-type signal peptide-containing protein [Staphylococcus pseudintermedius]
MKKNRKSKRLDFLPNKLNKYSIRKFTVGTASILIGSLMYLGVQNDAEAAEKNGELKEGEQNVTVNVTDSQDSKVSETSEINTTSSVDSTDEGSMLKGSTVENNSSVENYTKETPMNSEEQTNEAEDSLTSEKETPNQVEAPTREEGSDNLQEERSSDKSVKSEKQNKELTTTSKNDSKSSETEISSQEKENVKELNASKEISNEAAKESEDVVQSEKSSTKEKINTTNEQSKKVADFEIRENEPQILDKQSKKLIDSEVRKNLPSNFSELSEEKANAAIEYAKLKAFSDKIDNNEPKALVTNNNLNNRSSFFKSAFRAVDNTTIQMRRMVGTGHFNSYGDVTYQTFPQEFPNDGVLTAINQHTNTNTGTKGALQFDTQIGFDKDFKIKIPVANNNQPNTTDADGWGFIFTKGNGQDFLSQGGILRDSGIPNSAGFKIDTSYNNVSGKTDPLDADKINNLKEIGGRKIGYGTFVRNNKNGSTEQVGQNAIGSKDNPVNKIEYADNATNFNDGKFHGQRLNDVVLSYSAATSTLTATYAGKTWTATVDQLGLNKNEKYNFLITSSQMSNRYSYGIMRTKLSGIEIDVPADNPQAEEHNPGYEEGHTKPNVPVEIPQTGDKDLPPNTKFEIPPSGDIPEGWTAEVDPNTGVVTVTPPADA